jgi:hypothetical protein
MSDQSFEPDGGPQFEELRREIVLLRNAGRLHVALSRAIDALVCVTGRRVGLLWVKDDD